MANKGTQEGQCQSDTADLADSVLDCLSTGMKIIVVFAPVVVLCFFPAILAMAASLGISLGVPAVSSGRQPAVPPEVSGHPGPLADLVPPQVLPDPSQVVVVPGEVPPVGGLPDSIQVVVVPGEVPPVGGLPDSVQVGVNSGGVPSGGNGVRPIQVGMGHSEVPPVGGTQVGGVPERFVSGARRTGPRPVVLPGVGGVNPPCSPCPFPPPLIQLWVSRLGPLWRREH